MFMLYGRALLSIVLAAVMLVASACSSTHNMPVRDARDLNARGVPDLSGYTAVIVDPVEVELDPDWRPTHLGTRIELPEDAQDEMREDIAATFNDVFPEALTETGKLRLASAPGPNVVRIKPKLTNVYLNSPAPRRWSGLVYARSVGYVGMQMQFVDAATGEALLELNDYVRGRDLGMLRPTNELYNRAELSVIFEDWAQVIREDLFHAP